MKHRKVYIGLLMILGLVTIWFVRDILITEGVSIGYTVQAGERPEEWHTIISQEVNDKGIILVVDGNVIDMKQQKVFMDDDMNIMLPENIFTEAFQCSINCYDKNRVRIQKGNIVVTGDTNSDSISIGSEYYQMGKTVLLKDNIMYVQAQIMEKGFDHVCKTTQETVLLEES